MNIGFAIVLDGLVQRGRQLTCESKVLLLKHKMINIIHQLDGLVQDYSISIVNAPQILQDCTKPSN